MIDREQAIAIVATRQCGRLPGKAPVIRCQPSWFGWT
jgi:hypothetical protein